MTAGVAAVLIMYGAFAGPHPKGARRHGSLDYIPAAGLSLVRRYRDL
jgi:hypothetical protein